MVMLRHGLGDPGRRRCGHGDGVVVVVVGEIVVALGALMLHRHLIGRWWLVGALRQLRCGLVGEIGGGVGGLGRVVLVALLAFATLQLCLLE